jgi:short subunit dehydrogenase-like uncharacterized protein
VTGADRHVALLGATGFTGRLVAAELTRRGIAHRLGGRSASRLAAVPSPAEQHLVDLHDPASLEAFLDGADVLISCVGPFTLHGMPVVEAAVRTGTPYVDSTGEFGFMAEVYDRFSGAATPVVPACGFDYLPGDLAAAVAVEEVGGTASGVDVVYRLRGMRPSRGTVSSAAAAVTGATLVPHRLTCTGPDGPLSAIEVPWGEEVTVPRHVPGARVRTGLVAPDVVTRVAAATAPLSPLLTALTKASAPLLDRLAARLPEGPRDEVRSRAEATVLAVARAGAREATVVVRCRDIYGLTARLLVEAALQVTGSGAMAPAEALPAKAFLDAVTAGDANGEVSWNVL